ncbi:MAG: hypothetical protein VX948_20195 [Candidatus Latescibacterota bacterium]|nr:hypothetical protein [Candidatus Latescibacterota bacterium]
MVVEPVGRRLGFYHLSSADHGELHGFVWGNGTVHIHGCGIADFFRMHLLTHPRQIGMEENQDRATLRKWLAAGLAIPGVRDGCGDAGYLLNNMIAKYRPQPASEGTDGPSD